MKKINRLKSFFLSAAILSLSTILLRSISLFFNVFLSNKIGNEGMGLVTLTSGVYSFAVTFATSGINFAVVRLVSGALPYSEGNTGSQKSTYTVSKIMKKAFIYCLVFSSFATIVLFFFAKPIGRFLLDDLRVVPSLKIMALSLIPISLSSAINGYFYAVRRVYKNVIVSFFEQTVKFFVITSLLISIFPSKISYGCLAVALGGLIGEIGSVILNLTLFLIDKSKQKSTKFKSLEIWRFGAKKEEKLKVPSVFGCAFPIAISAYARSFLYTVEHLLIPWGLKRNGMSGGSALGSYGILCGMVFPLIFFPSSVLGAFSSLLIPEISASYEAKDFDRIRRVIARVFGFSLIFSICVSGVFISFSNEIGGLFFETTETGVFIKLLAPLIPIMYLDSSVDAVLKGIDEHIHTMQINVIDSLISVFLVLILTPWLGIYGYVITIYVTEIFNATFSILRLLKKTSFKPRISKWIIKPLFSIIFAVAFYKILFNLVFSYVLPINKVSLILEISICVIIYVLISKIVGSISKEETNLIKSVLK